MPNTKQPEQNKNLLEYHNKQLGELNKIQLFVDIEVNLLKKWNSLKSIQDLENLLSQQKLDTLDSVLEMLHKQIITNESQLFDEEEVINEYIDELTKSIELEKEKLLISKGE